jgi:hypothetical protein
VSVDRAAFTRRPRSLVDNPWLEGWYEGVMRGRRKSGAAGGVTTGDREVATPPPAVVAVARQDGAPFEAAAVAYDDTPGGGIPSGTAQVQHG